MERFVAYAPRLVVPRAGETALGAPTGGRLPMGLSVGPRVGPDYVLCGDAGGSINPFNGEGISYGYETGRIAAAVVGEALSADEPGGALALRGPARGELRPLLQDGQHGDRRASDGRK